MAEEISELTDGIHGSSRWTHSKDGNKHGITSGSGEGQDGAVDKTERTTKKPTANDANTSDGSAAATTTTNGGLLSSSSDGDDDSFDSIMTTTTSAPTDFSLDVDTTLELDLALGDDAQLFGVLAGGLAASTTFYDDVAASVSSAASTTSGASPAPSSSAASCDSPDLARSDDDLDALLLQPLELPAPMPICV